MLEVVQVMWPRILWWAPVVWLLKESDSKICTWQVTHLEVHLNIPCWMGGMELSLVGGTSARTRRFLRLGGRLKAIIGSSGMARWRRSEVWRIWWLALVSLSKRKGGAQDCWYYCGHPSPPPSLPFCNNCFLRVFWGFIIKRVYHYMYWIYFCN